MHDKRDNGARKISSDALRDEPSPPYNSIISRAQEEHPNMEPRDGWETDPAAAAKNLASLA